MFNDHQQTIDNSQRNYVNEHKVINKARSLPSTKQTIANFTFILMMLLILLPLSRPAHSQNYQAIEDLEHRVKDFATQQLSKRYKGASLKIDIKPLDRRLKFPQCASDSLTMTSPYHKPLEHTKVVSVECQKPYYWSLYVPLELAVNKPAVVSRGPIPAGKTITDKDVEIRQINILSLNYPTFDQTQSVIGKLAKRHIPRGQIIRSNGLKLAKLIEKGEIVTLTAVNDAIRVSTKAVALNEGRLGDRVTVKNLNSNKVIAAKVVGKRQVVIQISR